MLIRMMYKHSKRILSQRGGGIAIVAFGVVVLLVFIFTAMNILNAKLIEQGYNNLRDAIMSASSGSVIHLLLKQDMTEETQKGVTQKTTQNTTITYDPYLQLALGYIINYEEPPAEPAVSNKISVEKNNFIKLDHKKVVNSTLQLIDDTVLGGKGTVWSNFEDYQIIMFFIEPNYNDMYEKSFNLIWYTNENPNEGNFNIIKDTIKGENMQDMYNQLQNRISQIVNEVGLPSNYQIKLNSTELSNEELVRRMETRPYYLIVVKDFALPTLFNGESSTTRGDNVIKGLFQDSNRLSQPMCALQSGKIERVISND